MPIFEYICQGCGHKFEALVYGEQKAECPVCKSPNLAQQLSVFAAHTHAPSAPCGASGPTPCGMSAGGCCGGGACGLG